MNKPATLNGVSDANYLRAPDEIKCFNESEICRPPY